jgi:hypothetical protein
MIALPPHLDLTAHQAAVESRLARERLDQRGELLLRYLNQIRAAHELGEQQLVTTCLAHELEWLSRELRERGFAVEGRVHLMHGQLTISWSVPHP